MPAGLEQAPDSVFELPVSAPPSADFLFIEEYRRFTPDALPDVKSMSTDFDYLLEGHSNRKQRMIMAVEYAGYLKDRFTTGVYESSEPGYAQEQILSRVYLDTFVLAARRQYFNSVVKNIGRRYSDEEVVPLRALISSKLDLQSSISEYVNLNSDKDSSQIFGNLAIINHHSRRLVYGDELTSNEDRKESLAHLAAILAEYKVLTALRNHWPQATFGSAEQDRLGTDIIIPSGREGRGVALQVKSSLKPTWDLLINSDHATVPKVKVPMDFATHDPLSLSTEHSEKLTTFVRHTPHLDLTHVVYQPLQTGVDELQLAA